jgi:hypothetical protein
MGATYRRGRANRLVCRPSEAEKMGILDDAIREHLELKRQHGAEHSELQKIEDEAFGPPARPGDPTNGEDPQGEAAPSEAPTEFLQAPPPEQAEPSAEEHPAADHELLADSEPDDEEPMAEEARSSEEDLPSAEEGSPEQPQAVEEPRPAPPDTEEREAIAAQPTELYDFEAQPGADAAATPEAGDPVEAEESSSQEVEDQLDGESGETLYAFEEDDFFDEQSLSDELDQALEAGEGEQATEAPPEAAGAAPPSDAAEEVSGPDDVEGDSAEGLEGEAAPAGESEDEDVLEETPDFLQDAPESDRLWFEQKPPKDFDFDD